MLPSRVVRVKQTAQEFLQDKAPQLGAALAYYTVFSLTPLTLVLLAIIGVIFRNDPTAAFRVALFGAMARGNEERCFLFIDRRSLIDETGFLES